MSDLQTISNLLKTHEKNLFSKKNVVAVGIGYKTVADKQTDKLSIICSVVEKKRPKQLSIEEQIPKTIEDVPTDVIQSGEIVALKEPTERWRPVPGGVSIGHRGVTAGTLGSWVKKEGVFHLLSNNHVIAKNNAAKKGDPILQPGAFDGGNYPKDEIAELVDYIPIKFGGPDNLVDAAIAIPSEAEDGSSCAFAKGVASPLNWLASIAGSRTRLKPVRNLAAEDVIRDEILEIGKVTAITEGLLDMKVKKYGRTTGLTTGKITQIGASVKVSYGVQSAWFKDQLITTNMSQGGDSGSLVVEREENKAVGLLFAGSDFFTVLNRIQSVFDLLKISF